MPAFSTEQLTVAYRDACVSWPDITLPYEIFATYVQARLSSSNEAVGGAGSGPQKREYYFSDLYLACACVHNVPGAVERMLDEHRESIDAVARRVGLTTEARDDLVQILGERLFVADVRASDASGSTEKSPPRIAQYTGTGPLRAWVKAVATRIALDLVRRGPRDKPSAEEPSDEKLVARIADSPDVQLEKESDRNHLRVALRSSFQNLSSQERNLLRYALLDGLSIDELARVYQIHRATAARRLVASRDRLADGVKEWLRSNLKLDESACISLVKGGLSQVDLTLRTVSDAGTGDNGNGNGNHNGNGRESA